MLGNSNNSSNENNYENKFAISFRRWAKDVQPYFTVKKYYPERSDEGEVKSVWWIFKGVLFNPAKDVTTADGRAVTIQPSFSIVIEDGTDVYYVQIDFGAWSQMRATLNSLLSAEVWDAIELYTKTSTGKDGRVYKVINVSNPNKKKEITYKDKKTGEEKTIEVNESYMWAYSSADIPAIEVVRDWDEILKVKDEAANEFFKEKIAEKFSKEKEATTNNWWISVSDVPF